MRNFNIKSRLMWAVILFFITYATICMGGQQATICIDGQSLQNFEYIYGPDYFPITNRTMYYVTGNGVPYSKIVIEVGDANPFLPKKAGCRYYQKHVFFPENGVYYFDNTWHMRNCLDGEVAEIADAIAEEKGKWRSVYKEDATCYYYENPITHFPAGDHMPPYTTHCDWPIRMWCSPGPGEEPYAVSHTAWMAVLLREHFDEYTLEHGSQKTYKDVVKRLFIHGGYAKASEQAICSNSPVWCPHYAPWNSYWVEQWHAKGVGLIKQEILFYEKWCDGSLVSPSPENWKIYLRD